MMERVIENDLPKLSETDANAIISVKEKAILENKM